MKRDTEKRVVKMAHRFVNGFTLHIPVCGCIQCHNYRALERACIANSRSTKRKK